MVYSGVPHDLQQKLEKCKSSKGVYGIFNSDGRFIEAKERPNICGVPHCKKCEKERQGRLMEKYKPYFDAYPEPHIRHVICTVPVIPRSELSNAVAKMLKNVQRFHESMRKTLKYRFRALLIIECHYQRVSDTYNFHVHYGVFNLVDIRAVRKQWCRVWENDSLIVKYPFKHGKPCSKIKKYAFLEYMTRRRVQQARTMPLEDYYSHIRHRQMLKRIGFTKEYLAVVTTLRKNEIENKLPDGYFEVYLGDIPMEDKLSVYLEKFRDRYRQNYDLESDIHSVKTIARISFKDVLHDIESKHNIDDPPVDSQSRLTAFASFTGQLGGFKYLTLQ